MVRGPSDMWGASAFRMLVDSIGRAEALVALGVSKRTLSAWLNESTPVPRCAVMALYWESAYGQSLIDSAHHSQVVMLNAVSDALRRENELLRQRVQALSQSLSQGAQFGCANDLFFDDTPTPPSRRIGS